MKAFFRIVPLLFITFFAIPTTSIQAADDGLPLEYQPYYESNEENVKFIVDEVEYIEQGQEVPEERSSRSSGISDMQVLNAGRIFLGGKPQKIKAIQVIKEFKANGVYYYKLKIIVERASADKNGKFPMLKAKRYRDAIQKVLGYDKSVTSTLNILFPKSIDTRKFPTLFMVFNYDTAISNRGPNYEGKRSRKPKGKRNFVEKIQYGFRPSTNVISVKSCVSADPKHPISQIYTAYDWFTFLTSLPSQLAKYLTKAGISEAVLQQLITTAATCSTTTVRFNVLAKVPKLKGMKPSKAGQELAARNLKVQYIKKESPDGNNKVSKQSIKPGKKVKAGTVVKVTYRAKSKPPKDEIDTVLGLWRFGSNNAIFRIGRGNGGFHCTLTSGAVGSFNNGERFCRGMTSVINNQWVGEQKIKDSNGNTLRWEPWTITRINNNTFRTSGGTLMTRVG